mgnify:FL=1
MLWFYLALITAVLWTFEHTINKHILKTQKPEYVSFVSTTLSCILSVILLFIFRDKLVFSNKLFLILIPVALVNASARIFYAKSLKLAEMSKAIPLLALSPIFTLFFAFFILGEKPPFTAIFGIIFAVIGIYVLNSKKSSVKDIFEPFKNIVQNKGIFFMFLVSMIYGLGGVLDKYSVSSSNVITYLLLVNPVSFIVQGLYLSIKDKKAVFKESKNLLKSNFLFLLLLTFIAFGAITFQFWAVSFTYSSYVIAIKRTSALFSVVVGYFVFKEKHNIWKTLLGTAITLIGTYFVLFS